MDKIETVIFDLGGVLIDWNPRYVFEDVFDTAQEVDYFLAEVCTGAWNGEQDRGRSFQEAIQMKVNEFPQFAKEIPLFFSRWTEMISGEISDTVKILEKLYADRKVRLYALTNWSAETFPYAWENFAFLKLFEGILVSGKEKMIKPDLDIYELLLRRYDIEAKTAIFIDDSMNNIIAANSLGINGIHFTSAAKLSEELKSLQLL